MHSTRFDWLGTKWRSVLDVRNIIVNTLIFMCIIHINFRPISQISKMNKYDSHTLVIRIIILLANSMM